MRKFSKASAAAAVLTGAALLVAQPAAAAEGLVNGGFDATLDPWTVSGGIGATLLGDKALIGFNTSFGDATGTLSQTFTTTAAGVFDFAFDAGRGEQFCNCGEAVTLALFLDGMQLADLVPAYGGFTPFSTPLATHISGSVNLAAGDHTFSFTFTRFATSFGRAPYILVDSVSGVLTPGAGVPEPATGALMIGGFGLAGATLRRRRRALA